MAKRTKLEAEVFSEIRLNITKAELDAAIAKHEHVLLTLIRAEANRPVEGDILTLINTIKALRTEIIPKDDPAGRGIGLGDDLE